MAASSNFGNMFSVVGGSIFLPFLPMLPVQILTNNILYDFSQMTIPTDKVDEERLLQPKKWNFSIGISKANRTPTPPWTMAGGLAYTYRLRLWTIDVRCTACSVT